MKSYSTRDMIHCPHCNEPQTDGIAEDYVLCFGSYAGKVEIIECEVCYENFPAQYNKTTGKVDVTF